MELCVFNHERIGQIQAALDMVIHSTRKDTMPKCSQLKRVMPMSATTSAKERSSPTNTSERMACTLHKSGKKSPFLSDAGTSLM
jgi:hypothetical protein